MSRSVTTLVFIVVERRETILSWPAWQQNIGGNKFFTLSK